MRAPLAAIAMLAAFGATGDRLAAQAGSKPDDVAIFLQALQRAVQENDLTAHEALLAESAFPERIETFVGTELKPGMTRVVLHERDRRPLIGVPLDDGYRLVVDAFEQSGVRARIATWAIEIIKGDGPNGPAWQID